MLTWKNVLGYAKRGNPTPSKRVEKTKEEWKNILTPETFRVTQENGTERPHSSAMCTLFEAGKYACACCKTELFDSTEKFDSGTGWPSFTQPTNDDRVAYVVDESMSKTRVETICNICDAHLGHVFPDGPAPSGLRYCINAVALEKINS